MEPMSDSNDLQEARELALGAARLLEEHKGRRTVVLDISRVSSISDFFVIATAGSTGHLRGLMRRVDDYLAAEGITLLGIRHRSVESGWILRDCGFMVVHLMTEEMRDFYDLDSLWFQGEVVYQGESPQSPSESGNSPSSASPSS